MENPIKMDDLVVPPFSETPIYSVYLHASLMLQSLLQVVLEWVLGT